MPARNDRPTSSARSRPHREPHRGRGEQARLVVGAADAGARLDVVLRAWLPGVVGAALTNGAIRRAILAAAVSCNGRIVSVPGAIVARGDRLAVRIDRERLLARGAGGAPASPDIPILFEDRWLIAVDKPAGLPTVPSADRARESLVRALERLLSQRDGHDVLLGVHQRLDRDTSGVIVFVKDPAANAGLARAFETHAVEKVYRALTIEPAQAIRSPQRIDAPLARASSGRASRVAVDAAGAPAVTDIRVVRRANGVCDVEARPRTGRQHQVRAHLAHIGMPILGDVRYGGPRRWRGHDYGRVQLRAVRLHFVHPVTGHPVIIEVPA